MKSAFVILSAAVFGSILPVETAFAAEARYIDDRSDAAALVRSLYSAVSRKEYSRAWDYFGDAKPAKDFDAFAKGYEATEQVNVRTGAIVSEGAAGSIFYSVPVAIESFDKDGNGTVFGGCYTARLSNPAIQGSPFRSMQLEKGSLKLIADTALEDAVPASCPDAPAPDPAAALFDQAKAAFAAAHGDECTAPKPGDDPAMNAPEAYPIAYHDKLSPADEPEQHATLFRFFCSMGAYNESHIYYLYKPIDGLQEQHFATPELDIRYENDNSEGKVESVSIVGFRADAQLVNSFYDEATKTVSSHAKWRGVGDASSSGLWIFRDGEFTLVKYDVDASYDGEINPETVLDYDTAP